VTTVVYKVVTNNAPSSFPLGSTTVIWIVTDIHGNTNTASQTVTVTSTLAVGASAGAINCNGGSTTLTVNASEGGGSYTYSLNGGAYQPGNTFIVTPGTYTVTVRDNFGCTISTNSITIPAPPPVTGVITGQTNASCTSSTGSVTVSGSGGTGAIKYSLDGGPFVSSGTFTNLSAGTHTVIVRDDNLCSATVPVNILQAGVTGTIT
jgi:hypothetical protein